MELETVCLNDEESEILILDQTRLPNDKIILHLKTQEEIFEAIYLLQVRGAPAIGVTAGFGSYLAAKELKDEKDFEAFYGKWDKANKYLDSSRPTAVNLSWALKRMDSVCRGQKDKPISEIIVSLKKECMAIYEEDIRVCRAIGENGLTLVKSGDGLLTHCNAGRLAAVRYGTATAPMYVGAEKGYDFHIYADETRPLLQGARLTATELHEAGLDVTLLCDNMSASLMSQGKIQAVFVGCDRVASNGDTANKIGTSLVAIAAKYYHVPFYVCAPMATIDFASETGADIVIEQRKPEEVTRMWYEKPMAAEGVKVYNPAFDVTPAELITAIVTEKGIAYPPFSDSLQQFKLQK